MRPPLRIAILECDEPIGKTKEKYGGYGNLFTELLHNGALEVDSQSPPQLDILKYDIVNHEVYPSLEDVDAVLLTGSKYNSFDNDPWILKLVEFTRKVLAQRRVRLIGVCFGHQIIGRAMDVKVDRSDRGWEVSVVKVTVTPKGRALFGIEDGKELAIHQMHRDVVYTYPSSVEALGHTDRCDVQGMYEKGRLITVQGHPEFTGDIVEELLESRHEKGIFDDKMFEEGLSRVRKPHDGVKVGAAFIRFLLEE
jgi:GMP synthase-like glutamine amidotransferase